MAVWRRNKFTTYDLYGGSNWEDAIGGGNTYLRTHIRWGFHLDAPLSYDIQDVVNNLVSFGVCTTIGNGTETPPNAATQSADQNPPTQRWIYWETRSPVVTAIDHKAGLMTFRDSGSTEPSDTKGMVLATGLPAGDTLNLWSSFTSAFPFDPLINGMLWTSLSILKKS